MRVVCIGAGPGGLYAALLLKRRHPTWEVAVLERNGLDETFGFGVVFSEPTLQRLQSGDPRFYEMLLGIAQRWDPIELRLRGGSIRCSGQGFVGVGRHALLALLRREAEAAGVELRFHALVDPENLPEADVLVVSEGASSAVRRSLATTFEPTIEVGRSKFIWFGTTQRFECLTFLFEASDDGAFAVHAYPFADGRSTFIVETDDASLERAGLVHADRNVAEQLSIAYCEKLFAAHLGGHRLLANQSRWAAFRTVRNQTWRAGRVILIGDAAHTAHFSMGSGTKMALEDALALDDAFATAGDVEAALASYEAVRRPEVRKVQQASRPSLFWWETFRHSMERDLEPFAFHFLTRNLRVTRDSLVRRDPAFIARVERWYTERCGGDATRGARGLPLEIRGLRLPDRNVSDGFIDPSAGLALLPSGAFPAQREGALGVTLTHDESTALCDDLDRRLPSCDWLELTLAGNARGAAIVERVRTVWNKPLSVRLLPGGRTPAEVAQRGITMAHAGADVVTLSWAGKEQPDIVACAEALRFTSDVRIAVDPREAEAEADTLLLSGRADLCLARPGS